ncbi:MAG TPA: hypothetical protein VIK66_14055 [Gaiellaceae bacterium]|jgi:hypothetical protein
MRTKLKTVLCAFVVAGATAAGAALAGEVKGPPGVPCGAGTDTPICTHNTDTTGALDHANSACAASGLNDMDPDAGQTASQVQTAADSWKYYGLPKGSPGTLGLCKGGTGER